MYDICCVGHITLDKVVTTRAEMHMAGGTAFYFSSALQNLDTNYLLITSVAESEMHYVDELREKGIEIWAYPSAHTVYFENIYPEDQDHRTQNVLQQADPFSIQQMHGVDAEIYHLGPLLAGDISTDFIRSLAGKGKISLDAQGYLRKVEGQKVYPIDWPEKQEALQYVDILKADEAEMSVLTGYSDVERGVKVLAEWGVKEAVITNGSHGSTIYNAGVFYNIPAYKPEVVEDATGCGDTYMAGYLYYRAKGIDIEQSGQFAAAMASLKMGSPGPFTGTEQEIIDRIAKTK
ncbi:PfkB family carbohydrate kinase [Mucilaginibacter ginsenosidivorans]|uniref:Ribokinase n=1 Tax=Mucilaginibacter ginsenosidivorans TaxID=398053 RepID=A0A5B8UZQ7_9SPHI|nr:PfkB family carbohydrate kinase [Mucilaginibacter ginsenosidivorans]QEC64660.1 ribokinase [Mucilaginibacter ginsenosidivorans]